MKKILILIGFLFLLYSCRKKAWEMPDTSGKKCWDCERTITYPDTVITTKEISCEKTESEIREYEVQQSINLSKVKCQEKQ